MPRAPSIALTTSLLVVLAAPAQAAPCAYTGKPHPVLRPDLRRVGITLCREHFAEGSPQHGAVLAALDEYGRVEESGLSFFVAGFDEHRDYREALAQDGVNRIDIVAPQATRSGDASFSGRTRWHSGRRGIVELDVVLNRRTRWRWGAPRAWSGDRGASARNVLLHELGHGIGFQHGCGPEGELSVMGAKCGKWIGDRVAGLKAWDHGHVRFHYGTGRGDGRPDLVLGNFRARASGRGVELGGVLLEGAASPGQDVPFSWTLFNTGAAPVTSCSVHVLLSRDPRPSKDDVPVATLTREDVRASSTAFLEGALRVPDDLRPGAWFVVLVVDPEGGVAEACETNNALALPNRLHVGVERPVTGDDPRPGAVEDEPDASDHGEPEQGAPSE